MGRSRSSKDQLHTSGCMPRRKNNDFSGGGYVDHWMQDVHPKKGALHKELGIPADKKISTTKLEKAEHSDNPLLRKRANLAMRYRGK